MAEAGANLQNTTNRVNLEDLVQEYFWDQCSTLMSADKKKRKLLRNDQIAMEVKWDKVTFEHMKPKYTPEIPKPGCGTPMNNILFATTFSNKTDQSQTCSFTASRATKSSTEVTIEHGYTGGQEVGLCLKTPGELLELNLGFQREISLTNGINEVNEEEMTWSVDNQLTVKGNHRAEASLTVTEEEYEGSFETKTYIHGTVQAVFTNLADNNSWIGGSRQKIDSIIRQARQQGKISGDMFVTEDKPIRRVVVTSKGKCKFKYGLKQTVQVEQFPI